MKTKLLTILGSIFVITSVLLSAASYAAPPVDSNISGMLQTILPTVVNIKAQIKVTDFSTLQEIVRQRRNQPDATNPNNQNPPGTFTSVASGVIVDAKNGYILTNAHVIADAQSITVTLGDGRHFAAKLIGLDKPSDIAVIQIKAKNLTAIPLGDSNELKVGDFVAAIGNPFGLNQTVTSGIVSALGRTTLGIESFENFIQTDASINPGNSGGALIDIKGRLIGINTAILAPDRGSIGIGFAIPSNMAKSIMLQMIQYGNVKRGSFGIGVQDITPELGLAFGANNIKGAAITQVAPYSPAETAGIQVNDIIMSIDGVSIKNASDVLNTVGFLRVNSKVKVEILRNNKPSSLTVLLSDPQKRKEYIEKLDPFLYGVALKNFTLLSPIHGNVEGILVVSVDTESRAWVSELRPGDVIISVNQQKVKNITELKEKVSKVDKILLLNVLRGPSALFLVINLEA